MRLRQISHTKWSLWKSWLLAAEDSTVATMAMVVVTCHDIARLLSQPCASMRLTFMTAQHMVTPMAMPTCAPTPYVSHAGAALLLLLLVVVSTMPFSAAFAYSAVMSTGHFCSCCAATTKLAKPYAKDASPATLPCA